MGKTCYLNRSCVDYGMSLNGIFLHKSRTKRAPQLVSDQPMAFWKARWENRKMDLFRNGGLGAPKWDPLSFCGAVMSLRLRYERPNAADEGRWAAVEISGRKWVPCEVWSPRKGTWGQAERGRASGDSAWISWDVVPGVKGQILGGRRFGDAAVLSGGPPGPSALG